MYCQKCNAEIASDDKFCGNCGHSIGEDAQAVQVRSAYEEPSVIAEVLPPTQAYTASYATYHELARQRDKYEQLVMYHTNEAAFYERSLNRCFVAGIICTCLLAPSLFVGNLIMCLFLAAACFFMPFGMAPILHFTSNKGWFIVFNWVFIFFAAAVILTVAIIAGPIYLIQSKSKIKQHKERAASAQTQVNKYMQQIAQFV